MHSLTIGKFQGVTFIVKSGNDTESVGSAPVRRIASAKAWPKPPKSLGGAVTKLKEGCRHAKHDSPWLIESPMDKGKGSLCRSAETPPTKSLFDL